MIILFSLAWRVKTIGQTKAQDDLSQTNYHLEKIISHKKPKAFHTQGSHLDYGNNQLFIQSHESSIHVHNTYLHKPKLHTLSPLCLD